ncbi:metal-dependent hydrolase [Hydrogenophaga flava]|uniref:metal-dependent hydrolase n=1 Tax=Hydrogenophaga flava TaxID=65657 RepID=UPI000824AAF1|nr:metal-dependent hydrolase [Hydrogenophaga flava]
MATYLHFAPAVALAVALGPRRVGWRLMVAGALCGVMPDLDFVSVTMGFDRYSGTYGHRGFTHSLGFALLIGLLGALWPADGWRRRVGRGAFLALCTASHPLLDSLFDVGICSAWLWPLDGARHCLDWRPVPMQGVALFGEERFLLELQWIGVPLLVLANVGMLLRHLGARWTGWARRSTPRPVPVPAPLTTTAEAQGPRARRRQRVRYMNAVALAWMGRRAQRL